MDFAEIKKSSMKDLKATLVNLKKTAFNLRFQKASGELEKTHEIRKIRKDIARVNTAINEQQAQADKGDKNA